jgi:RNA polymerase sigma-70 factor (ECF subfamily)
VSLREEQLAGLMRAAMSGDAGAYRQFLFDVTPHLRSIARNRCRAWGVAEAETEDIVQEVLLAVHLKRGTWDQSRPIGPWLAAITRNKLIDVIRRNGRHVAIPIEDVMATLQAEEPASWLPKHELENMLKRLRNKQQEIVRAISVEGISVRETAARLNMTEGAVRVSLHRALQMLAALYGSKTQ